MKDGSTRSRHARFFSRWMLGLIFLLLFASHIALPCALASSHGAARGGMCRENKLARTSTDSNQYFQAPMPKATDLAVVLTVVWLATVSIVVPILSKPNRLPLAFAARGRPFASSDQSFLPCFAAKRDA